MKNKYLTIIFIALASSGFSQNASLSPYSYFGLGQAVNNRTSENNAMGGVSVYADSTQFSFENPATLGKLKFVQYRVGVGYKSSAQQGNNSTANTETASLNYLALSVPTKHFVFSFGLKPKTATGYRINTTGVVEGVDYTNFFEGSGGLNSTFLAVAVTPYEGLSLGLSANYNFGLTEKTFTRNFSEVQLDTRVFSRSELSGILYTFGAHYERSVFSKYKMQFSISHTPKASLNSVNTRSIATITTTGGLGSFSEMNLGNLAEIANKLPSETSLGIGIGEDHKWFVGASYLSASTGITNDLESSPDVNYESVSRMSLGGFYIPKYDSFTNYLSRIVYRAGIRLENTGLNIQNQTIKDFGINFGLGLPMSGLSKINIGVELGQLGTLDAGLVKENYTNIMLGFSLSDVWFIKRKYD